MKRALWMFAAVALLAACPKNSSRPAQEVPVEIDWPDAAVKQQSAISNQQSAKTTDGTER